VSGAHLYAEGIVKRMTGNPSFPSPVPPLATVTAAVDELRTAEAAALARTKGACYRRGSSAGPSSGSDASSAIAADTYELFGQRGVGVQEHPQSPPMGGGRHVRQPVQ
jgi:hypothetical protein